MKFFFVLVGSKCVGMFVENCKVFIVCFYYVVVISYIGIV